jgi:hypothetical protein
MLNVYLGLQAVRQDDGFDGQDGQDGQDVTRPSEVWDRGADGRQRVANKDQIIFIKM